MAAVPCGHCLCERCSLHVCSIMYVCMYVFKYARRLANIGRQPQGAALQYQKELASGNEIGRRTEQRCYPEKPRSQGLSKKWHGWAILSQERTLPHSGTHVHCQNRSETYMFSSTKNEQIGFIQLTPSQLKKKGLLDTKSASSSSFAPENSCCARANCSEKAH